MTGNEKHIEESRSDEGPGWFASNIGWIAATCIAVAAVVGLVLRYEEVKTFCKEHIPCLKEEEKDEVSMSLIQRQLMPERGGSLTVSSIVNL